MLFEFRVQGRAGHPEHASSLASIAAVAERPLERALLRDPHFMSRVKR